MPNQLYNEMNKQSGNDLEVVFGKFMTNYRGQDPAAIINSMVQSGKISQAQLNMVQQRAQQLSRLFDGLRKNFGF